MQLTPPQSPKQVIPDIAFITLAILKLLGPQTGIDIQDRIECDRATVLSALRWLTSRRWVMPATTTAGQRCYIVSVVGEEVFRDREKKLAFAE